MTLEESSKFVNKIELELAEEFRKIDSIEEENSFKVLNALSGSLKTAYPYLFAPIEYTEPLSSNFSIFNWIELLNEFVSFKTEIFQRSISLFVPSCSSKCHHRDCRCDLQRAKYKSGCT